MSVSIFTITWSCENAITKFKHFRTCQNFLHSHITSWTSYGFSHLKFPKLYTATKGHLHQLDWHPSHLQNLHGSFLRSNIYKYRSSCSPWANLQCCPNRQFPDIQYLQSFVLYKSSLTASGLNGRRRGNKPSSSKTESTSDSELASISESEENGSPTICSSSHSLHLQVACLSTHGAPHL